MVLIKQEDTFHKPLVGLLEIVNRDRVVFVKLPNSAVDLSYRFGPYSDPRPVALVAGYFSVEFESPAAERVGESRFRY